MTASISTLVNKGMVLRDGFAKVGTAHIQADFFEAQHEKVFFSIAKDVYLHNNTMATKDMMVVELGKVQLTEDAFKACQSYIDDVFKDKEDFEKVSDKWLMDESEKWCLDRSVYLGISKAVEIMGGTYKEKGKVVPTTAIPSIVQKSIAFSFQKDIGHDLGENAEQRYDLYHQNTHKIPFLLEDFNRMTDGGFERKTVNVFIGPTGKGKSMTMCSLATDYYRQGKKSLYITLEMREFKIAQRIDANLLNVPMKELKMMSRERYLKRLEEMNLRGMVKVREYATKSAGASHFRLLLDELDLKKKFKPDVLFVDYMGICRSDEYGKTDNMYLAGKGVAEELRALAVDYDLCVVTASQTNRTGQSASDFDMTETSESHGINMTADWIGAIIVNDDLLKMSQMKIKQLKTRYDQLNNVDSFLLNVDYPKMRLTDNQNKWSGGMATTVPTGRVTADIAAKVAGIVHSPNPADYVQVPYQPKPADDTPPWETGIGSLKNRKLDVKGFK